MIWFLKKTSLCILLLTFLFQYSRVGAHNLDSLEYRLQSAGQYPDLQLKICEELSNSYLSTNPLKSRYYALKGLYIAESIDNQELKATFFKIVGTSYIMDGKYDSSEIYLFKAKELASSLENDHIEAMVNLSIGTLFTRQKKIDEAMLKFCEARNVFEKNGDRNSLRRTLGNIAALFMYQHNFPEAEKYYRKSEKLSTELNDHSGLGQVYSGLTRIYLERGLTEKALEYALSSAKEFNISGEKAFESVAYKELANIYLNNNELQKAISSGQKSYAIAKETGLSRYVSNALSILAQINFQQKYFQQSIEYSVEALKTDSTDSEIKSIIFSNLMKCNIWLGREKEAIGYFDRYKKEIDSQVNENYRKSVSEMEVQYQTEKKELTIQALQAKKRVYTFAGLSVFLLMLMIVILLIYREKNIRSKKEIAEQKITQLEKERQLIAAKSVLQGEEAERSRLASDLHDGLGGLLTSVKLKLSSMKDNSIITSENMAHFNHALDLLDTSITEMRHVAHNLMPETLMHYGLQTALNDFINQVEPEGFPIIRYNTYGENLRFEKEIEITLYRISQELVTNSIKHADAKQIDIQLFTEKNRICIQVNDNGIGFDPEGLDHLNAGKGLKNISDRVTAFNGRFELISQHGKGTESTIEFLIT